MEHGVVEGVALDVYTRQLRRRTAVIVGAAAVADVSARARARVARASIKELLPSVSATARQRDDVTAW